MQRFWGSSFFANLLSSIEGPKVEYF
jgi:hypothetical protein